MSCISYINSGHGRQKDETMASWYSRVIGDGESIIYKEGTGCLLQYNTQCSQYCTNPTKAQESCFKCLGNGYSCPLGGKTSVDPPSATTPPKPCCPNSKPAILCMRCLSAYGGGETAFERCVREESKSKKLAIIIGSVVGGVVLLVIVIAIVYAVRRNWAKQKLAEDLQDKGVDQHIINQVIELRGVDQKVFNDVDTQLSLKKASQKHDAPFI